MVNFKPSCWPISLKIVSLLRIEIWEKKSSLSDTDLLAHLKIEENALNGILW